MKTIVKYDLMYLRKTSKLLIVGILGIFLSGLSVLSARYFNRIIEFAMKQEGIDVQLPPTTVMESYTQYFSNMTQIYLFVLMFISIAFFNYDKSRGHYPLIFSKPILRRDYILSKSLLITVTIVISLILSALFFGYYTYIIFGEMAWGSFLFAMGAFTVFLVMLVHIGLFFSVLFRNYFLPLIATLGIFIGLSILSILEGGIFNYMPQHLISYPLRVIIGDVRYATAGITMIIAVAITMVMLLLSVRQFHKKSLL